MNFNIGPHIFYLVGAFVQCRPVKGGQQLCHLADLCLVVEERLAVDGGEAVVQKVRVDLCLQRHQLCFFQCDLIPVVSHDQAVKLADHVLEAVGQLTDLVGAVVVDLHGQIPLLDAVHGIEQEIYLLREKVGQQAADRVDQGKAQQQDDEDRDRHLVCGG